MTNLNKDFKAYYNNKIIDCTSNKIIRLIRRLSIDKVWVRINGVSYYGKDLFINEDGSTVDHGYTKTDLIKKIIIIKNLDKKYRKK